VVSEANHITVKRVCRTTVFQYKETQTNYHKHTPSVEVADTRKESSSCSVQARQNTFSLSCFSFPWRNMALYATNLHPIQLSRHL